MTTLARVRAEISGPMVVGPASSTFYFDSAGSGFVTSLLAFYDAIKNQLANGLIINIANSGELIDDATGDLAGTYTDGTGGTVTGGGLNSYVVGVGGVVEWATNGTTNNRRVVGRTFLVPMDTGSIVGAGQVVGAARTIVDGAASTFLTNGGQHMRIWTRPKPGVAGKSSAVTSGALSPNISWLRSRRT